VSVRLGFAGSGFELVVSFCEHGNEPSGSGGFSEQAE
jgi:hypothetical protein